MAGNATFMTWNPNKYNSTSGIRYEEGNTFVESTSGYPTILSNMAPRTGKWYVEFYMNQNTGYNVLGVEQDGYCYYDNHLPDGTGAQDYQRAYMVYSHNGNKSTRTSTGTGNSTSYVSSWGTSGKIIGCALDMDNGKIWWSFDGTFGASGNPATGTNAAFDDLNTEFGYFMAFSDYNSGTDGECTINAGQDSSFAGAKSTGSANASDANGYGDFYYTPPSGYLAICSANLPTKTEIDPVETSSDYPQKQFDVALYSGTSATQTIDIGFQPDIVWWKNRGTANSHILADSSRGVDKVNTINNANSETNAYQTYFTAFSATGPTFSSNDVGTNQTGNNYAALCWRCNGGTTATNTSGTITSTVQVNQDNGLAIVQYTGNGSNGATIGHGLGKAPEWILVKNRDANDSWAVYHIFNGNTHYMLLDSNAGKVDNTYWNDTTPSSTVFTVGTDHKVNASTEKYVAYCWTSIPGFSAFGGYDLATDNEKGPFIHTGFRPKMVIIKMTVSGDNWGWVDSRRNTVNPRNTMFTFGSSSGAESTNSYYNVDFYATGFQVSSNNAQVNHSSYDPYIYMAWADIPGKFMQGG